MNERMNECMIDIMICFHARDLKWLGKTRLKRPLCMSSEQVYVNQLMRLYTLFYFKPGQVQSISFGIEVKDERPVQHKEELRDP